MRVLRVKDLKFVDVPDVTKCSYAILSHVWDEEEIEFRDVHRCSQDKPLTMPKKEKAISKFEGCRSQARKDEIPYFWIDTCCIDKPNHSELNEAINSMYYWYKHAKVCYAYLSDVPKDGRISESKWFTRGWTLQELIAPTDVVFFDQNWGSMGRKLNMVADLSRITNIREEFLLGRKLEEASVAERMSWASQRSTSKEEDLAYCLLGIFDVHMPLLYGEHLITAFRRLQLQILEMDDDTSIFAWQTDSLASGGKKSNDTFALLAPYPSCFKGSHNVKKVALPRVDGYVGGIRTPISFNNKGLHLSLPVLDKRKRMRLAILGCEREGKSEVNCAVWLKDIATNHGRYVRVGDLEDRRLDKEFYMKAHYENLSTEVKQFKSAAVVPIGKWEEPEQGSIAAAAHA
jgi:hypothetical protein